MQAGSIVKCIKVGSMYQQVDARPKVGEIYTVKNIEAASNGGRVCITLDELDMGFVWGEECGVPAEWFVELLPPAPIEELIGDALTAWTPEQEKEIFTAIDNDINGRNDRL